MSKKPRKKDSQSWKLKEGQKKQTARPRNTSETDFQENLSNKSRPDPRDDLGGTDVQRKAPHLLLLCFVIFVGCFTDGLALVELGGHHPGPRVGPENRVG